MKTSELRSLIREEIKNTFNEGAILKSFSTSHIYSKEVKAAIQALEKSLQRTKSIIDYKHAAELARLINDIVDAAKAENKTND